MRALVVLNTQKNFLKLRLEKQNGQIWRVEYYRSQSQHKYCMLEAASTSVRCQDIGERYTAFVLAAAAAQPPSECVPRAKAALSGGEGAPVVVPPDSKKSTNGFVEFWRHMRLELGVDQQPEVAVLITSQSIAS